MIECLSFLWPGKEKTNIHDIISFTRYLKLVLSPRYASNAFSVQTFPEFIVTFLPIIIFVWKLALIKDHLVIKKHYPKMNKLIFILPFKVCITCRCAAKMIY